MNKKSGIDRLGASTGGLIARRAAWAAQVDLLDSPAIGEAFSSCPTFTVRFVSAVRNSDSLYGLGLYARRLAVYG